MQRSWELFDKVWYYDTHSYPALVWEEKENYVVIYSYALGQWTKKLVNPKNIKRRNISINENIYYHRKKVLQ